MWLRSPAAHVALWLGIFVAWLLATRHYHPTPLIAALATAALVAASALAVYLNGRALRVSFVRRRSWVKYAFALTAMIAALSLFAVLTIQAVYGLLWGPDPRRFGFWFNFWSDGVIIALHLVGAACVKRVAGWWRGGRTDGARVLR